MSDKPTNPDVAGFFGPADETEHPFLKRARERRGSAGVEPVKFEGRLTGCHHGFGCLCQKPIQAHGSWPVNPRSFLGTFINKENETILGDVNGVIELVGRSANNRMRIDIKAKVKGPFQGGEREELRDALRTIAAEIDRDICRDIPAQPIFHHTHAAKAKYSPCFILSCEQLPLHAHTPTGLHFISVDAAHEMGLEILKINLPHAKGERFGMNGRCFVAMQNGFPGDSIWCERFPDVDAP